MWTCAGLLLFAVSANAITRDQFYPHGPGLDQRLPRGHDIPSPEVPLKAPIVFYGEAYDSIYVNNFGVLTFRTNIPQFLNAEFPLPYPSIAAFYANVDTTDIGTVFYRETDDPHVIGKAEETIQNNFNEYFDFKPTSVFIATWLDVTYTSNSIHDRKNSFQVAVISNGNESFVELLYPESEIQWIQKETQPSSLPDAKAQAGFVAEDGRLFTLRGSGSHQIRNIVSWSNANEPGKYVFRVGNIPVDGNIVQPDQYDQYEAEIEEESKTCAQSGPSFCHMKARCVDYQAGICCQCDEGYYGNGKSCIKDDLPLRVHGKVNGVLNEEYLNDVDIQSYVVVTDGRSYTAISQSKPSLGGTLQLLNVLGGVIGWLFAKPSGTAKNGYQLSGALLNHSAEVFFPTSGDRVTINQEFLGHDVFDQITLETDIRGSAPFLPPETKLEVAEYDEQYTLVETGLVRSKSIRTFTDKFTGEKYEAHISQTFTFNPCRFAQAGEDDTVASTLKVSKNYLGYEVKEKIVRYGSSNKIWPLGQEDPCIVGRSTCGPHSSCVVQGDSFTCVCQSGFTNVYEGGQVTCIDVDECAARTHNCDTNADCFNHNGGFQCRCRVGYEGNGVTCSQLSKCINVHCDPNAQCREYNGQTTCVCNPGYTGDGQRCWLTQDIICDACSPNADCVFSMITRTRICQCKRGFSGDGHYCVDDITLQTTNAPTTSVVYEVDYNETYVLPNCYEYGCECPAGYSAFKDERNNDLCRLDSNYSSSERDQTSNSPSTNDTRYTCNTNSECPPNAICSLNTEPGEDPNSGHCVCPEGYEGDAYECIEKTGSSCECGPNAHCTHTASDELLCICNAGYQGDGYDCRRSFSCSGNEDCEYHAECRQDAVTYEYVCQCVEGYIKDENDACIKDAQLCNGAVCAEHASCLYDGGIDIHYCHCDEGYVGEGIEQCVPVGNTCDVANDCNINAVCTPVENSYRCVCQEGFNGDGYNCVEEINCRTNPYLCDTHASCLKRRDDYKCECNSGYNGNGSYCKLNPRKVGSFLVASDGASVYKVPFVVNSREFATPINSEVYQTAVGVDVDCKTGRIFWGDIGASALKSASYDGSMFEIFLSNEIKAPEGIAIDWSARNIFWTDSRRRSIEVANLDTKIRRVLFQGADIQNPRGIAVHPQRGKVFWSDWTRANPKIEWANMDGTKREVFLGSREVKLPNSLAIDWSNERLCFADAGLNSIKCVSIRTREVETVAANCSHPFGLAITEDKFYWSDWKTQKIESIDRITQDRGQVPIATASRRLFGVAVAQDHCPRSINACEYAKCKTDEVCLPDDRGLRVCLPGN